MKQTLLVVALGSALLCMTAQAAEQIIQPSDRQRPDAAQSTQRAKSNAADRRATAATARRPGSEQGKVREAIEPEDRTGMTHRDKPTPRSIIEPQDRQIIGPNNRPGHGKPSNRLIEGGSVGAPNFTVGHATARRSGVETGKVREIIEPTDRARMKTRANNGQRSVVEPQDLPRKIIEPADRPAQVVQPEDRPRSIIQPQDKPTHGVQPQDRPAEIIDPEDEPRQLTGPGHRSRLIRRTDRPRRDNEKTTPLRESRRPIGESSVVAPDAIVGDARPAARERWRALAEEFAFGTLGNFVTKLARPGSEDAEGEIPDVHNCARPVTSDNRCAASSLTRRDR